MADVGLYTFTFKELTEILIKKQNIHEGHWQIHLEFQLSAGNLAMGRAGPGTEDIVPAIIAPITKMGIKKIPGPNPMSVDAATANPVKTE